MLICSCCVIRSGATSGLICPISSDECKQTLVEWFFFFLHMKNFHEPSGEKWVCLCMCDVDSVDCRPQLLPFITTCQNGRHFLPPHTQKAYRCCFFFINAACLRECNDGKCNKQDNKCIYSVYAGGVELWFKVVSLFPNCVYALDGLIWNNSFVINNMYRRLGSAREIRKHTSKKFPWKQRFYATTDVF